MKILPLTNFTIFWIFISKATFSISLSIYGRVDLSYPFNIFALIFVSCIYEVDAATKNDKKREEVEGMVYLHQFICSKPFTALIVTN